MKSIPDNLVEETRRAKLRPRLVLLAVVFALNLGFLFGQVLQLAKGHGYLFSCLLGLYALLNVAALILSFREARTEKVFDDPDWPAKVRQMRRRDDPENYPLVAAAVALEKSEAAKRRTSEGRHGETREMREMVVAWWQEHKGSGISKDKAAEEMAGKLVPLKFATVREYLKGL